MAPKDILSVETVNVCVLRVSSLSEFSACDLGMCAWIHRAWKGNRAEPKRVGAEYSGAKVQEKI